MIDSKVFENNRFIKVIKDKKVIIKIYSNDEVLKSYEYNFETNIVNSIPDTDFIFAIAFRDDNNEYLDFFINLYNENPDFDSCTRTYYPGLTDQGLRHYMFGYGKINKLKIGIDEKNNYLEISIK